MKPRVLGGVTLGIWLLSAGLLSAQTVQSKADMPVMIQLDFGPYGSRLPGDGNDYCYPTSASMLMFWLHDHGYSQIAAPFTTDNALKLDLLLGGLMQTSSTGGTTVDAYQDGLNDYLHAKGIATADITWEIENAPSLEWFNDHNGSNSVVLASISWFYQIGDTDTYAYDGGHGTALVAADPTNQTLTVNNPYPSTFYNVQNLPANGQLTVATSVVPANWILEDESPGTYFQVLTPILGPGTAGGLNSYGIYDTGIALTLAESAKASSPATWTLSSEKILNTNGGFLSVLAPLAGTGGFTKRGEGELQLQNTNALTGSNNLNGGTFSSTAAVETPFGTGDLTILAGTLAIKPSDTGTADLAQTLAAGSGNRLHLAGGANLQIDRGTHAHLTLTIGGQTDGSTANLQFANHGTLAISVAGGLAELGATVKVKAAGFSANLPPVTNGMVSPAIVGQETNADLSGAFLTYGAEGLQKAIPTSGNLNAATANTIYQATSNQILSADAAVYALAVEAGVTVSGSSTLSVGPQTSGEAGIILNGGEVNTALTYGSANAKVYVSQGGGTLAGALTGSGTFVQFGPGTLTLSGDSSATQTSELQINSGVLNVAASGHTGTGDVTLLQATRLEVAGTVGGTVIATETAEVVMKSGTVQGGITLGADASLRGNGTLNGTSTLSGSIYAGESSPGILTFGGPTSFLDGSQFFWRLADLLDNNSGGVAGTDWNALAFTSTANFGSINHTLTLYMDIPTAWDPNSTNPFWDLNHVWTIATAATGTFDDNHYNPSIETWSWLDGNFYLTRTDDQSEILLHYVATVPEPGSGWLFLAGIGWLIRQRKSRCRRAR